PPAMPNFAVTLVHGPGWDPSRQIRTQDGWDEHAAFMDGLVDDGFIIVGGPLGDGDRTLHVVEAADERQIETRFGADPRAVAGLWRLGSMGPGALGLDGRRCPQPGPAGPAGGLTPAGPTGLCARCRPSACARG